MRQRVTLREMEEGAMSGRRRRSMSRLRVSPFLVVCTVVASGLAAMALYPLIRVVGQLFVVDGRPSIAPVQEALAQPDLVGLLGRTTAIVIASSALALLVGGLLAWINERTDARWGTLTDSLPFVPFLLPPIAGAIGWVFLLSPESGYLNAGARSALRTVGVDLERGPLDIFTWYGLLFVYVIYMVPFAFMFVSAGLRELDGSLEEQSRVNGAGMIRTLRKVTFPVIRPSLGGALLLLFWFGFALFSVPVIIGSRAEIEVLSVRIVRLLTFTYPPSTNEAVGLSMFVVVVLALAWWMQARILRAAKHGQAGGRGVQRARRIELKRWKYPARALMISYGLVAVVLPICALLLVALSGYWSPSINWGNLSLRTFEEVVFDNVSTQRALRNSLFLGIVGGAVGVTLAAMVSLIVARSRSKFMRTLDGAIKLPAAISNIVIAVGFVLGFAGHPFYLAGTVTLLFMAYLVLYMPQASVASDAALSQVGNDLSEASRISGAGYGRTFRKIVLPLMMPGLIVGWALLFVRMVGDVEATALLAGPANPAVGLQVLQVYESGSYDRLAALATTLTLLTSIVLVAVLTWSRRRARWSIDITPR